MDAASDDRDLRKIKAKLEPDRVRSTLAFTGLYQLTHEMLKRSVIQETKAFFGYISLGGEGTWIGEQQEAEYKRSVLSLSPKKPFEASLLWLVQMDAITREQSRKLDQIYSHRHGLTHELAKYLVDVDFEPDLPLFLDAVSIFRDLDRFWLQAEFDIGSFDDHEGILLEEIHSGSALLLDLCIRAYTGIT